MSHKYLSQEERAGIRSMGTSHAQDVLLDHAEVVDEQLAERDRRIAELTNALKGFMFLEQTEGGRNPHKPQTNRYSVFEQARAVLGGKP